MENLILFKFLNKYDFEFMIFWDWNWRPIGDKWSQSLLQRVEFAVKNYQNVFWIVPPMAEKALSSKFKNIIPLWHNYIYNQVLPYSIVGRLGLVGDFASLEMFEKIQKELFQTYTPNDRQKQTKGFQRPPYIWFKEVTLRKYFLLKLSFRDWMVRKIIKFDLRYFKDAKVDTLVPLTWDVFAFEKAIKSKLGKRIKFHWLKDVEIEFHKLAKDVPKKNYNVEVLANGRVDFLLREKKWMWLLQRGKQINLKIINFDESNLHSSI